MPVGLKLCDYQGAVVEPWQAWSGDELLAACDLHRFNYENLLSTQNELQGGGSSIADAPYIDLSRGFAAYRADLAKRGEKEIEKTLKKQAKLERAYTSLEFTMHDERPDAFESIVRWKSAQYDRTGATNPFKHEWVIKFLKRLITTDNGTFSGVVSTLRADGQIIAGHIGMQTPLVIHHWFPAHDPSHAAVKYSPGMVLLAQILETAADNGSARMDLGKGAYSFKQNLASGTAQVLEGSFGRRLMPSVITESLKTARQFISKSAEATGFRTPVRWYRQLRDWVALR
jgi:CelD/BcsL family acetyltransferase involved in cellulose biosynthesis